MPPEPPLSLTIAFVFVMASLALSALRKAMGLRFHVPTTAPDPDPSTAWSIGGRIVVVLLLLALVPSIAARMGEARVPFGVVAIAGVLALGAMPAWLGAFPWVLAGRPRSAFLWMRVASMNPERRAAAVLEASLALARMDRDRPEFAEHLAFLEKELDGAAPRGPTGFAATGLVAALRGDDDTARAIFHWIDSAPRGLFPARIRGIALRWLVADHARRGDFTGLAERMRGRRLSLGTPPFCVFLGRAASRIAAIAPLPSDRNLRIAFWLTPRRALLRPLLERALRSPSPPPTDTSSDTPTLAHVLRAHLAWLRERGHRHAQLWWLVHVAYACDALRRSAGGGLDEQTARVLAQIEADLERTTLERGFCLVPLAGMGPTLQTVFDKVCDSLFREVEARLDQLRARVGLDRETSAIDEWIEWATFHEAISRAYRLGGEPIRGGSFAAAHGDLCNYGAWLFNERRHHLLAHHVFRWLLGEAEWMEDEEAIELFRSNASVQPA